MHQVVLLPENARPQTRRTRQSMSCGVQASYYCMDGGSELYHPGTRCTAVVTDKDSRGIWVVVDGEEFHIERKKVQNWRVKNVRRSPFVRG